MNINICTSDVYHGDAIGNFSLQMLAFLKEQGHKARLFARYFEPYRTPEVMHLDLLESVVEPDDLIIAQYSIFEASNALYRCLPNRKIVYYHGITPSEYFANLDQQTEKACRDGILQAPLFEGFDFYMANSQFMLNELVERLSLNQISTVSFDQISATMPPVIDLESRFTIAEQEAIAEAAAPFDNYLLYVGRIVPHKKLEDLIGWFHHYIQMAPNSGLVIVGSEVAPSYSSHLRQRIASDSQLAQRVIFRGHVTDTELYQLYRGAAAFVTFSEHEGFCVPLVEAMGLGLPVFARASTAVPETLGRSGLMLRHQGLELFAREVHDVLHDPIKRNGLISQQSAVYRNIVRRSNGDTLLSAIESVLKLRACRA